MKEIRKSAFIKKLDKKFSKLYFKKSYDTFLEILSRNFYVHKEKYFMLESSKRWGIKEIWGIKVVKDGTFYTIDKDFISLATAKDYIKKNY